MSRHELKTWPEPFQAAWVGDKTFEIRNNDRGFKLRDEVILVEWDPATKEYSGREIVGIIRYITPSGFYGLPAGVCVFSIEVTEKNEG